MRKTLFPLISDEAATRSWRTQIVVGSSAGSASGIIAMTLIGLILCPSICAEAGKLSIWLFSSFIAIAIATTISWRSTCRVVAAVRSRMKSIRRFLQDAGHELATPGAMLKSRIQFMERELSSDTRILEHLDVLNESVRRLVVLIEDMRALARAEAARSTTELSLINIGTVVRSVSAQMKPVCDPRDITITSDIQTPATIIGDQDGIERVVSNLLSNAIRYGRNGGTINVAVQPDKNHVVLTVHDDGKGISSEALPRIFDRFYRENHSEESAYNSEDSLDESTGSGLGLAIVKAIVESHSGYISVESRPDEFTRFTIEFPVSPVHPLVRMMKSKM